SGVKSIYDTYGLSCPPDVRAAVDLFIGAMDVAGVSYTQQTANDAPLQGTFAIGDTWLQEIGQQHHATTYASLIASPAGRERLARWALALEQLPRRPRLGEAVVPPRPPLRYGTRPMTITGTEGLSDAQIRQELAAGARFVVFEYTISVIILT